jgi:hypothetical protein
MTHSNHNIITGIFQEQPVNNPYFAIGKPIARAERLIISMHFLKLPDFPTFQASGLLPSIRPIIKSLQIFAHYLTSERFYE